MLNGITFRVWKTTDQKARLEDALVKQRMRISKGQTLQWAGNCPLVMEF